MSSNRHEGRYNNSLELLERALQSIPLGSQTFSKSITQFPQGISPLFIEFGKGSEVTDVDGNTYIDFVNSLASVSIGYSDEEINSAVREQLHKGVTFSLPHRLETEVAELLIEMIPSAEKVRFGKNGTDATSAAIRLARAYTGRDHILVCGYHGWQDWYIGSTTRNLGVPDAVSALTHSFTYNDLQSLSSLFDALNGKVAAVIMEPMNIEYPKEGFLESVQKLCQDNDALLIFDETVTGCRFSKGGAQELFSVTPDLSCFGKGLANGFPLSAVVGREDVMSKMEDIFFSGTFGGETLSLAAAKQVLLMVRDQDVIEHLAIMGDKLKNGVQSLIEKHDLKETISISGHPSWTIMSFSDAGEYSSWEIKTLYLQEIFKRGILAIGTHNMSYAHAEKDIDGLLSVYDEVFELVSIGLKVGNLTDQLEAEPLKLLFKVR